MNNNKEKSEVVSSQKVSCNGESYDSSEGHPLVWFQINEDIGYVVCPYCEKKFVYAEHLKKSLSTDAQS